jgi:aminoglycoside phosphotransferase (APT) family kinase protein
MKMSKEDIHTEIMFIKKGLEHFQYTNIDEYFNWLKEYELDIGRNQIYMTPFHGDFWCPNILYNPETKKINVIDWENFSEKGNPFEDFIWLLCNLMGMSSKDPLLKFRQGLEGNGEMNKILEEIKNKVNRHFGFKLNYMLLMRINLMKWMIIQEQIREKSSGKSQKIDDEENIHLKILSVLSDHE